MMRHKIVGLFALLLGMILCLAVTLSAQSTKKDMETLRATMKEFVDAYRTLDAGKILPFYADDAMYLIPDMEILKGRQAIKEYLNSSTAAKVDFKHELVDLKIVGDLAYEVVNQMMTVEMKGQPTKTFPYKFIHVWKRQKDGSWKVQIDMFNSRTTSK